MTADRYIFNIKRDDYLTQQNTKKLKSLLDRTQHFNNDSKTYGSFIYGTLKQGMYEHFTLLYRKKAEVGCRDSVYAGLTWAANRGHYDCIEFLLNKKFKLSRKEVIELAMHAVSGGFVNILHLFEILFLEQEKHHISTAVTELVQDRIKVVSNKGHVSMLKYLHKNYTSAFDRKFLSFDSIIESASRKRKFDSVIFLMEIGFSQRLLDVNQILKKSHPLDRFNRLLKALDKEHSHLLASVIDAAAKQKRADFVCEKIANEYPITDHEVSILSYYLDLKGLTITDYLVIAPECYKSACLKVLAQG